MTKHEGVPSQENKAEQQSRLQKRARQLLLIAAFGVGGTILRDSVSTEDDIPTISEEAPSFEVLKNDFDIEIVAVGERYVLHIGQVHGQNMLKQIEDAPRQKEIIIKSQKSVERALLYLREKCGVTEVFEEGVDPVSEAYLAQSDRVISEFRAKLREKNFGIIISSLEKWIVDYAQKRAGGVFRSSDSGAAIEGYFIYCRLKEFFSALENEKSLPQEFNERLRRLRFAQRNFAEDSLIKDDQVYLWGAAFKLRGEGKITIRATEHLDKMRQAEELNRALMDKLLNGGLNEGEERKYIEMHNDREDDALKFSVRAGKVKFTPIVYGDSHDFSENLRRLAESGMAKNYGFIKFRNLAAAEWDKVAEEELPNIKLPSLVDPR